MRRDWDSDPDGIFTMAAVEEPSAPCWTRRDCIYLGLGTIAGIAIGAAAVVSDAVTAGAVAIAVAAASRTVDEALRWLVYALIGVLAAVTKVLQDYADGVLRSFRVNLANIFISAVFAVFGAVAALASDINPMMAGAAAFFAGLMGFKSIEMIEDRLRGSK